MGLVHALAFTVDRAKARIRVLARLAGDQDGFFTTGILTAADWAEAKIRHSKGDYTGKYSYQLHVLDPEGNGWGADAFTSDTKL